MEISIEGKVKQSLRVSEEEKGDHTERMPPLSSAIAQ